MRHTTELHCSTGVAAKMLGLSVGTIHALLDNGNLSGWRTSGGHRRIWITSLEQHQGCKMAARSYPHKIRIVLLDELNSNHSDVIKILISSGCNVIYCNTILTAAMAIAKIETDVLIASNYINEENLQTLLKEELPLSMITIKLTGLALRDWSIGFSNGLKLANRNH
jgi:excisionase family DNA binding protein